MKAARTLVASTPGLAETLASDSRRAAAFCALRGITPAQLRDGVPALASSLTDGLPSFPSPLDAFAEVRAREAAVLPRSGEWA